MLRRFTKEDWYGWAGAERFEDGSEPFIGEFDDVLVVACRCAIEFYFNCEEEEDGPDGRIFAWHSESLSPAMVELIVAAIVQMGTPTEAYLLELGFTRIN